MLPARSPYYRLNPAQVEKESRTVFPLQAHSVENTEAKTFQLPSSAERSPMVLWRPGLRPDASSVEFPLEYRELDRYNTNELQHFTQEAARVYTKGENSRLYTPTSLKQLLSSINIAWAIINERRAAHRITVLDPGSAKTRTVYMRAFSGEEHIYLSPWTHSDPGYCTDDDSESSSTEQSNGCGHSTEDKSAVRKGGQQRKLHNENQKQTKGKAHHHHQRKTFVSKAKNLFSSQGRDGNLEDYERPRRRARANKFFEYNSLSDSEPPPERTKTNQNEVKVKAKHEGNMKLKNEPLPPQSDQRDQRRHSSDRSGQAAGHTQDHSSPCDSYRSCRDHRNDYRQRLDRPRSTPYSYTQPQLRPAAQSESTKLPRQGLRPHKQQYHTPQAPNTVPESSKTRPSQSTPANIPSKFNPYATLSLPPTSNITTIKAAIRALSLRFHPDKQQGNSDAEIQDAYDRMCEINNAKAILLDDVRKKAYDEDKVVEEDEFEEWLEKQKSKRGRGKEKPCG